MSEATQNVKPYEVATKCQDAGGNNWDAYGFHPLDKSGDTFLAFVADAPASADVTSGALIKEFINQRKSKLSAAVVRSRGDDFLRILLADIATAAGLHMLEQSRGKAYCAVVFALVRGESAFILSVGDCAAWLIFEPTEGEPIETVRMSETTRFAGSSFPELFGNGNSAIDSTLEDPGRNASYLGAAPRAFTANDVVMIPTGALRMITLVSDGPETQLGATAFHELLRKAQDPAELKAAFDRALGSQTLVDDLTVLAVRVFGRNTSCATTEFVREELEKAAKELKAYAQAEARAVADAATSEASQIKRDTNAALKDLVNSEGGLSQLGKDVGALRRDLAAQDRSARESHRDFATKRDLAQLNRLYSDAQDEIRKLHQLIRAGAKAEASLDEVEESPPYRDIRSGMSSNDAGRGIANLQPPKRRTQREDSRSMEYESTHGKSRLAPLRWVVTAYGIWRDLRPRWKLIFFLLFVIIVLVAYFVLNPSGDAHPQNSAQQTMNNSAPVNPGRAVQAVPVQPLAPGREDKLAHPPKTNAPQ